MEAQGVHIVMSAKTALELGAPIRGIYSSIHLDVYVSFHAWILRISSADNSMTRTPGTQGTVLDSASQK
jgi:hypothetical protein